MELPKTEQELQAIIDSAVKQATDEIVSKHNGEMATLRTRHSAELDKVRKEANMSAEELAKQKASELAEQQAQELSDLRNFKKQTILKEKLANSNLPSYFVNDTRLLSAEEGELDKVIKSVKNEYEASQPKGTTHSTVVQTSGAKPQTTDKDKANELMGNALKQLVSNN